MSTSPFFSLISSHLVFNIATIVFPDHAAGVMICEPVPNLLAFVSTLLISHLLLFMFAPMCPQRLPKRMISYFIYIIYIRPLIAFVEQSRDVSKKGFENIHLGCPKM